MQRFSSNFPRWLAASLILCVVWCLVLALDLIPGLRGDFGWRWPYATPDWLRLLPAIVCVVVYVVIAQRLKDAKAIQAWAFAGAVIIPCACLTWFGVLMPVWVALTILPLYRLGGKWAALWWPLIPSLALFAPVWNTFYPLLAVLAYFALDHALRHWQAPSSRQRAVAVLLVLMAG